MPQQDDQLKYYGSEFHGETFCEAYFIAPDLTKNVHGLLKGEAAYDHWHLAKYFNEILDYRRLAEDKNKLTLDEIPRKERNLFLYEIFRYLQFRLSYFELGTSLFEVIDGLEFTALLLNEKQEMRNVVFQGVEISPLFRLAAETLHPAHRLVQLQDVSEIDKKIKTIDVLYDRAVSSYCYETTKELAGLMNKSAIGFLNLWLSQTLTFDELKFMGKAFTYFSLPGLLKNLNKPLYFLFGRVNDDKIEGFFLNCRESDSRPILDSFKKNRILRDFLKTKEFKVTPAGHLLRKEQRNLDKLKEKCFRRGYEERRDEFVKSLK